MKSSHNWNNKHNLLALYLCLIFVLLIIGAHGADKTQASNDSISIDCGAKEAYIDETNGIWYETDEKYIESGSNHEISPFSNFNAVYKGRQLKTVRSFPEGRRNCYTMKPNQNRNSNNNYLIRAVFAYGNYDNKNQIPTFDLYLGVNFWYRIELPNGSYYKYYEIIQQGPIEMVQVCLLNTGEGTPFINALELRVLTNYVYSASLPLFLADRVDCGSGMRPFITRYKDDAYDRFWTTYDFPSWGVLNTTTRTNVELEDSIYKLPSQVLRTASQPLMNHSNFLFYNGTYDTEITYQYLVFLHFAEIQNLPSGHKRIVNVTFDDKDSSSHLLEYSKPITLSSKNPTKGYFRFRVSAASESDAPPILNAYEIYKLIEQSNSPTNAQDVNAIMEIKRAYGVSKVNWQGDPCVPQNYAWDGLSCNSDNNSRIISLNLRSSNLTGHIVTSFANLEKLEFLDLSNNGLTGQLPQFLADLPNLKFINLTGNKLTGSIPKAFKEKANLQLSVGNNPGLYQIESSKEHKFVIPLIIASIAILVIIVIVSLTIWRLRKEGLALFTTESQKMRELKQKSRVFSYSQVLGITNNFETTIGEGGFGKVYLGTLEDGTQVAVKLLSASSKQGYKEFQSEAQLLEIAHHRNLVSLVGYCHDDNVKILIYEYMDNGDLSRQLSEKYPNVLKWNERLQVIVDAAKGLDYLHNGCKTPIIHRDLKPSNILLNKSMIAKIGDFGLSRAFINDLDTHLSTQPAGTPGYIDPEFQRSGILNKKSDIYSFGMILLQLITGHPPIRREPEKSIFILDWVRPKIECGDIQGIVDPKLAGEFNVISVKKVVEIAMTCVLQEPTQRPDISDVLHDLREILSLEIMDHATDKSTPSTSSLNFDSITTLSGR